ncbi:alpha beta-hydrolase [Phlebopus sp. FC_14]|nr:alpha beta-hydrolase [Phlebopus sp. FC_14]
MNNISFPVQIVAIIRRLFNVISTLSLTNQYLLSRIQSDNSSPQVPSERLDGQEVSQQVQSHAQAGGSWSWLMSCILSESFSLATASHSTTYNEPDNGLSTAHDRGEDYRSSNAPNSNKDEHQDTIHRLMSNPSLFNPVRAPRYPIVLCHGLYGFDVRGPAAFPSLRLHYWSNVLSILKNKVGADVIVTTVPGTGSIASRAENLDRILLEKARGRGVNFMAHSMGGLDCRHLITHVQPTEYAPLSLTSISTPHRGSPFMDWCAQYIGLGRRRRDAENGVATEVDQRCQAAPETPPTNPNDERSERREATTFPLSLSSLPSSFTTLLLSLLDSPAYANLTTSYLNDVFNPNTPNDPRVKYFSVASRTDEMSILHPLWLPKTVLDDAEKRSKETLKKSMENTYSPPGLRPPWDQDDRWGNDGLVTLESARWGEFLGILEGCDHWEIRGARGMELNVDFPSVPLGNITNRVGDGWAFGDWSWFIGAWKKQEKSSQAAVELASTTGQSAKPVLTLKETKKEREHIRQEGHDDPVVRASTDKLSAVFDWIVEQVPTPGNASSSETKTQKKKVTKNELATKLDLERFYVALTRKLYDEGL